MARITLFKLRRTCAWIALAAGAAFAIRAVLVEGMFHEHLWNADAVTRLIAFSAIYWGIAGAILRIRPAWFYPAAMIFILAYSEWWCARFFSAWAPAAVVYFLGSCFLLGRRLFPRSDAVRATLAGLSIWIFLISIAVHFPVNFWWTYTLAFAIPYFARLATPEISFPRATAGDALLVFVLMMHWLIALEPEVGSDALAMHLAVPSMIAQQGRFAFDFQSYLWALMPMGGDFAFTGVYLAGGEAAARLLNFAMIVFLAAMVYQASRRWLTPGRAAVSAALFASTPLVQLVTGSLFVENVWAALIVAACLALWTGETAAGAILLGAAFSTKLGTAAYLLPAIALGWLALRKTERRFRTAASAAVLFLVFAAPPYLYAWIRTRNPIFPFANAWFRSPYFDPTVSLADLRYPPAHNWSALYDLTFHSANFIEGQNGALGFQYFLLLLPLLLLFRRKAPWAPVAFGAAGAVITFWSVPNLRYLYPALPLISIGLGWMLSEIPALVFAMVPVMALNLWFLPSSGWSHREFALFSRPQVEQYLRASAPQRGLIEILNRVAPGVPVAFIHGDPIAGLHAKAYSDTWHTYRFSRQMIAAQNAAQMARVFHQAGVQYVITPAAPDTGVVQHFLEEWTAPTIYVSGNWEIRKVVDTRIVKPPNQTPLPPGSYDDLDERILYTGSWLHDRQFAETAGKSITYSNHPGDEVQFFFSGRSVTYVYTKAFNRGVAEVVIDGQRRARVDLYSKTTLWQQKRIFGGLADGPHALELRVTKRKNAKSSDYFVDLDEFVVE